ncbi:unnamed protein product [Bemisia tabaci]|uniref:Uncharacterized protein n=1 Tax=Bemisia tabaci TaxID=7038 RepID=A0A9P0F4D9_BEMTA|nr:unnamed protein product [Bemisia tabaci]
MEHAKKMILVPSETVERLHQPSSSRDPLRDLHSELSKILHSRNLSDDEKWTIYEQMLQRSMRYAEQRRKPLSFTVKSELIPPAEHPDLPPAVVHNEPDEQGYPLPPAPPGPPRNNVGVLRPGVDFQSILDTIPHTYRGKATALLKRLDNSGLFEWDRDGRVSIEKIPIAGANIADLINDAIRRRKSGTKPVGHEQFYKALIKLHVPQELIGNHERWNLIRRLDALPGGPILSPRESKSRASWPSTRKPVKRLEKGETKSSFTWEPFVFGKK